MAAAMRSPQEPFELEPGMSGEGVYREVEPLLRKDLRQAAERLTQDQVRYLVDQYYAIQGFRIRAAGQQFSMVEGGEPHNFTRHIASGMKLLEGDIQAALDTYTKKEPTGMGIWARKVIGIGPVIAAGLLAHVHMDHCPTVGHLWSFAGQNPNAVWSKGQKRPWNARLKVLCWKIGESFVKVSGNKNDIYGKVYLARKEYEQAKNSAGEYAEQARAKLEKFKIGKDTEAYLWYSKGKLPLGHIHARAKRYAVKAFLADFWSEYYPIHNNGALPPLPYPVAHLGHAHTYHMETWIEGTRKSAEAMARKIGSGINPDMVVTVDDIQGYGEIEPDDDE